MKRFSVSSSYIKLQQNSSMKTSKIKYLQEDIVPGTISRSPLFDHLITVKFFDGNRCPQRVNPNDQEF